MPTEDTQANGSTAPVEDTAVNQDGTTPSGVPNQAPDTTQGNASETGVDVEDTAGEKLFAGKYKTVEELEGAYKSAENRFHTEASEKAELSRTLNELFASPQPDTGPDTADEDFEAPDPLLQKVTNLERMTTVQNFVLSHNDADASSMAKVLSEDPIAASITDPAAKLEYAYMKSQMTNSSNAATQAAKQAAQSAMAKVAEKQAAQVEGAGKATPVDENAELLEKATGNYGPKEREAARLAILKKRFAKL